MSLSPLRNIDIAVASSSYSRSLGLCLRVIRDHIMVTSNDSEQDELPARDLGNLKLLYCGFISGLVQAGNLIAVILSDVLNFYGF